MIAWLKDPRIVSHRRAQHVAAGLAVTTLAAIAVWVWRTSSWLDLCDGTRESADYCSQPPVWLRGSLFALSIAGGAAGAAVAAYLARFAARSRVWPRAGLVATVFVALTLVWCVLYVVAILTIDDPVGT